MDDSGATMGGESAPPADSPLKASVLVLNKHYVAVRIVSARRAFIFLCKNYAEAIDTVDGGFNTYSMDAWMHYSDGRLAAPTEFDEYVRTPRMSVLVPRVIRLLHYDRIPKREVKFNRRNIIARD